MIDKPERRMKSLFFEEALENLRKYTFNVHSKEGMKYEFYVLADSEKDAWVIATIKAHTYLQPVRQIVMMKIETIEDRRNTNENTNTKA
jgi:hypothetical protein